MIKCELCGKEFRDGRGLAGHKRMVHNDLTPRVHLPEVSVQLNQLSGKVDDVLQQVSNDLPHLVKSLDTSAAQSQGPTDESSSPSPDEDGDKTPWGWIALAVGGWFLVKRIKAQSPGERQT